MIRRTTAAATAAVSGGAGGVQKSNLLAVLFITVAVELTLGFVDRFGKTMYTLKLANSRQI